MEWNAFNADVPELFRGGVAWRDASLEALGFPPSAQCPSLVWPADRAWVDVTEVDYDSTIVTRLEALPIREGADLTWDADEVNR